MLSVILHKSQRRKLFFLYCVLMCVWENTLQKYCTKFGKYNTKSIFDKKAERKIETNLCIIYGRKEFSFKEVIFNL